MSLYTGCVLFVFLFYHIMYNIQNFPVVFYFQVWNLGSPDPNFTLDAHQKGVNCVDYFTGGDKPYLITGSDDHTAKVCFQLLLFFFSSVLLVSFAYLCFLIELLYNKTHETGVGLSGQKLCSDSRRSHTQCVCCLLSS